MITANKHLLYIKGKRKREVENHIIANHRPMDLNT